MVKIDQNFAQVGGGRKLRQAARPFELRLTRSGQKSDRFVVPDGRTPQMHPSGYRSADDEKQYDEGFGQMCQSRRFCRVRSWQPQARIGEDSTRASCSLVVRVRIWWGRGVAAISLAEPRFNSCRVQHLRVPLPPNPRDFEARDVLLLGMRFLSPAILVKPAAKWLSECGRTQGPRPLIPE